jgi:hypothetical protein
MRGKYRRRRRARMSDTITGAMNVAVPASAPLIGDSSSAVLSKADSIVRLIQIEDAIAEAQKLKRAKKKGCSNLDRNMEALGYRRIAGDEMVPEQFEAIS